MLRMHTTHIQLKIKASKKFIDFLISPLQLTLPQLFRFKKVNNIKNALSEYRSNNNREKWKKLKFYIKHNNRKCWFNKRTLSNMHVRFSQFVNKKKLFRPQPWQKYMFYQNRNEKLLCKHITKKCIWKLWKNSKNNFL